MESIAEVVVADLQRPDHQQAVLTLTEAYARDPMGGGTPLPPATRERLIPALQQHPTTLIFLAYFDGQAVGLATCFLGLSTFSARPLLNIHDLVVLPEFRGRGVGQRLLRAVEQRAWDWDVAKSRSRSVKRMLGRGRSMNSRDLLKRSMAKREACCSTQRHFSAEV